MVTVLLANGSGQEWRVYGKFYSIPQIFSRASFAGFLDAKEQCLISNG